MISADTRLGKEPLCYRCIYQARKTQRKLLNVLERMAIEESDFAGFKAHHNPQYPQCLAATIHTAKLAGDKYEMSNIPMLYGSNGEQGCTNYSPSIQEMLNQLNRYLRGIARVEEGLPTKIKTDKVYTLSRGGFSSPSYIATNEVESSPRSLVLLNSIKIPFPHKITIKQI
ncbi:MAG: hypothetical protein M1607_02845 [Patescibacteria group bacterium]|nr:hypothetical protein [Patescibacteria group bacterium]